MPSQPPIPHILSPYLTYSTHSAQSLTIITSVLAATPNWLLLRFLHSVLLASPEHDPTRQESGNEKRRRRRKAKRVVLVSFLREWLFWKGEGKRLGLDLQRFEDGNRLRFVDGLSGLFDAPQQQQPPPPPPPQQQRQQGSTRLGPMGGAIESGRSIPMRGPASTRGPPPSTASTTRTPSQAKSSTPQQKQLHISGQGITALNQLENDILSVVKSLPNPSVANETGDGDDEDGNDILLILDQPDLILAMTPGVDANDMSEWVLGLQQHVHSTIITTSADSPLIHNANPYTTTENASAATPLEKKHASFVVGLAHRANMVLQLRTLDTGAAKDVSGVLRMSRGGGYDASQTEGGKEDEIAEKEVLYFVQRDGGVRVFGRGEV